MNATTDRAAVALARAVIDAYERAGLLRDDRPELAAAALAGGRDQDACDLAAASRTLPGALRADGSVAFFRALAAEIDAEVLADAIEECARTVRRMPGADPCVGAARAFERAGLSAAEATATADGIWRQHAGGAQ